jgi:hypothetical protein
MAELKRKKNKGIIYGKQEDDLHLVIKILLQKKILEAGNTAATEVPVHGLTLQKIVDVVDDDNRIIYEIEKKPTKEYYAKMKKLSEEVNAITSVIVPNKMPKSIEKAIKQLGKILEEFVIKK